MLGGRPALDRERVGGERDGADGGHSVKRGEDLPVGAGEQLDKFVLERGDVLAQGEPALDVTSKPMGTQLGVGGRRQQVLPAPDPELCVGLGQPPR